MGLSGYLLAVPWLAVMLGAGEAEAALAWALILVGSLLVVTAGTMLYARSEDTAASSLREIRRGLGPTSAVIALVGAGAVLAAGVLPVYEPGLSYLDLEGDSRWLVIQPLAVAGFTACLVLFVARARNRATSGAALIGLAGLAALDYLQILIITSNGEGSSETGSTVGLIGTGLIALAGLLAVATAGADGSASRRQPDAVPDLPPHDPRGLRTTRQLASAAHLDPAFAAKCVREVLKERHRAVAPSFGLDVGTVLRHCASARGRHMALAILLAGLTLPLGLAVRHVTEAPLVAVLVVLTAWAGVAVHTWVTRYRIVARHLTESRYDPSFATRHMPPAAERRVREVEHSASGNLVVYSGYRTHVGCGFDHGGWSFAVNVTSGREGMDGDRATPTSFTNDELYSHVAERLGRLELDDVTMFERMYVDGETIRDDPRFIIDRAERPRAHLEPDELAGAERSPEVARRYHTLTLCSWGGEIVFTTFMRFVRQGTSLYAEVTYYLLTPPRDEYRVADFIDPAPRAGERLGVVGQTLRQTLMLPLETVVAVSEARAIWSAWRRRARDRREISRNPRFDYGARTSVRELAQSSTYRRQVQAQDKEMFAKVIDREVLDAIIGFLDGCDIDTTELRERRAAVLNNGVIMTGGQLSGRNISVGRKARAGDGRPRPTAKPA